MTDYRQHRALLQDMSPAERFWFKVDKSGECWPWQGHRLPSGYGLAPALSRSGRPSTTLASRRAYELTYGPIPDGLYVCHHCDNPPCCNPAHLFVGSASDNNKDAQRKGRMPTKPPKVLKGVSAGMRRWSAKLTDDDVRAIRSTYATGGVTMTRLAKLYGVNVATVHRIIHRKRWAHVAA